MYSRQGEVLMSNNEDQSANYPTRDGSAPRSNSGTSTAPPPDTKQDAKQDSASEWIQSAMQTSKQMHRNEDFCREVAKRLF